VPLKQKVGSFRLVVFSILIIALAQHPVPGRDSSDQELPATVLAAKRSAASARCYAALGPLLEKGDGRLTQELKTAYLVWAENAVLEELGNQVVPNACLVEVHADDMLRNAMFGAVFPPDPSILQNYARLRSEMGVGFTEKYRSLVIATAVAKRTKGVVNGQAAGRKDFGRNYQSGFWVSESLQSIRSEAEKELVSGLAEYMKANSVAALELYQNPARQQELAAFLKQRNIAPSLVAQLKKGVQFGEWLKNAMVLLGQRPSAREASPDTITWLRYLVSIYEASPSSTPTLDKKQMSWPLFPINQAPWPLLMPLSRPVPLDEAGYVWETFQGKHGSDRYHTYGPFREEPDAMPYELRPSKWFWDAWPDRIVHGGTCVPLSKGTMDLYSSLGIPAVWAGQPGHANLISFRLDGGNWSTHIEQAFAGGPDVTFAQWYFNEDPGMGLRFRQLYNWAGAEYHLGLALGMKSGLQSYMDTRIAANIFRALPAGKRSTLGVKLLRSALETNQFNPEVWYRLATQMPDATAGMALAQMVSQHEPGGRDYWRTVEEFVTRYAVFDHPIPDRQEDMMQVYEFLQKVPGIRAGDLVTYAATYDHVLLEKGNAADQLVRGEHYRDGIGLLKSEAKAKEFFAKSASQGNEAAASALKKLSTTVPANLITITASSQYSSQQAVRHLVDGSGMWGDEHDNNGSANTMWHSVEKPALKSPSKGLDPSPAWVRFEFKQPQRLSAILIWNHNQANLTKRGFKRTRIYGSSDGVTWFPMTSPTTIQLAKAEGKARAKAVTIPNAAMDRTIQSVIIAAEAVDGNYGTDCFGLSAVRFVIQSGSAETNLP
jgi:F5/8 type C domain